MTYMIVLFKLSCVFHQNKLLLCLPQDGLQLACCDVRVAELGNVEPVEGGTGDGWGHTAEMKSVLRVHYHNCDSNLA